MDPENLEEQPFAWQEMPSLDKVAGAPKLLQRGPVLAPETIALIQQLSNATQMPMPVQQSGQLDLAGIVMLIVTLLGGGGAGWRVWLRSSQARHKEQLSEARKILIDNEDQHRKLNAIRDHLETLTETVKSLESKLPKPRQRKSPAKAAQK
jgi:hypothetical protein